MITQFYRKEIGLLSAVLVIVLAFFAGIPAAGATTVLEAYEKLKQQPEYGVFVQELIATGKVSEEEINTFISDLSSQIPDNISEDQFEEVFRNKGFSLILKNQYEGLRDACLDVYGEQWQEILSGNLPPSLEGVRDALKRELFNEETPPPSGGPGGGAPPDNKPPENPPILPDPVLPVPEQPAEPDPGPRVTFFDLVGHWAQQDIEEMAGRGIICGMSENRFEPSAPVTRAQFAVLLVRALNLADQPATGTRFLDVPAGAWYANAVEVAAAQGLVRGYLDGAFKPEARITREEMAVLIADALQFRSKGFVPLGPDEVEVVLKRFHDSAEIGDWARQGVAIVVKAGIVQGRAAGMFVPGESAPRAEAVVVMKRALDSQRNLLIGEVL